MTTTLKTPTFHTPDAAAKFQEVLAACGQDHDRAVTQWITAESMARCRQSFSLFCQKVLGYEQMLPDHHRLCEWIQAHANDPKLILMPRYSYKSSIATIGYALWCLLRNPNERVLIYSDTTEKAQGFLLEIRNHILGLAKGGRFRKLTHLQPWNVDPQAATWNQSAIVIAARTQAQKEPSVDTAGIETSKVGMHYDRIIFDDIVSDKNVTTKEQMDKVHECYTKSLSLLKPGGDVVMVGTRWHFGDLYGRLLAENHGTSRWQVHLRKAEEEAQYPFAAIGLTQDFLAQKRREQGSYLWSCLYQNEPVDDDSAIFKSTDFHFYTARPAHLYITACVDPAISESVTADDTAITVVGTDDQNRLHVLDAVAEHLLPDDIIEAILGLHRRWTFEVLGIETVAFQKMLKYALERRLEQECKTKGWRWFRIEEFSGSSSVSKEWRIRGLQPYHERGALLLPGERLELLSGVWAKLAYQMLQFPKAPHDDLVDSLAMHIPLSRAGMAPEVPEVLPDCPVRWERDWAQEQRMMNRRRPRWQREPEPVLAFSE